MRGREQHFHIALDSREGIQFYMAVSAAHPVLKLGELVKTLEAAIRLTLADPKPKPVHYLRTTARRIEAQLELLALLTDLPKHTALAKKARKVLRKIRRVAGHVRDLDVQRNLTQSKSHEAHKLRRLFEQRRNKAADRLIDIVHNHHSKLTRTLEALLKRLAPAEPLVVSATHIAHLTLGWYANQTSASSQQSHRHLHDIRKVAKLARYIAESASTSTRRLALTFESLQQSGGAWHDWLTLSTIAHRKLGSGSPLAQSFIRRCEESLVKYQSDLRATPKKLAHFE